SPRGSTLLPGGGTQLREIVLQKPQLTAVFSEVACFEGGLRRVVVVARRLHERGDLRRRRRGRWRRGARWWRRGRWRRLLLSAEQGVERFFEGVGHDDPALRREDHALELGDAARRGGLDEDGLDVDEAAGDGQNEKVPAD